MISDNLSRFFYHLLGGTSDEPSVLSTPGDEAQAQVLRSHLKQFLFRLQQAWWKQRFQPLVTPITSAEATLAHIIRWVEGTLTAENVALIEQEVARNEVYQTFHTDLKLLDEQLREADRFDPGPVLDNLLTSLFPPSRPLTGQPAWNFRGEDAYMLPLAVASEFDFAVQLFVGGFDRQRRLVTGQMRFEANSLYSPVIPGEATVWLLPAVGREWHSGQVNKTGYFELEKPVPPGAYTFEMAWPSGFLEVFDVLIPMD